MTAGYKIARSFAFNLDLKFRTFLSKNLSSFKCQSPAPDPMKLCSAKFTLLSIPSIRVGSHRSRDMFFHCDWLDQEAVN